MNPVYTALCLMVAIAAIAAAAATNANASQDEQKVHEEMKYIAESLNDLIGQLTLIKQEATGRLSKYKSGLTPMSGSADDLERIRQTKVSRFVLKRVAELESESMKMRDELALLSKAQFNKDKLPALLRERRSIAAAVAAATDANTKQEDLDFDELTTTTTTTTTTTQAQPSSTTQQQGMPSQSTTTMKPEEEAAKIGFDIEALKKLGEEIGKRLDQFGKEAVKNVGDLIEGIKLVFREPAKNTTTIITTSNRNKAKSGSIGGNSTYNT